VGDFRMPSLGADMREGTLLAWKVKPGDRVKRGDIIAEVATDKGDIEIEVFEDGVVTEILVEAGRQVPVGEVLARIDGAGGARSPSESGRARWRTAGRRTRRRSASLPGTGPGGAVTRDDVERLRRHRKSSRGRNLPRYPVTSRSHGALQSGDPTIISRLHRHEARARLSRRATRSPSRGAPSGGRSPKAVAPA
jgi:pyruvate dehydrogenase E2 component (dihydrolipoamide acetyltransferase)